MIKDPDGLVHLDDPRCPYDAEYDRSRVLVTLREVLPVRRDVWRSDSLRRVDSPVTCLWCLAHA